MKFFTAFVDRLISANQMVVLKRTVGCNRSNLGVLNYEGNSGYRFPCYRVVL